VRDTGFFFGSYGRVGVGSNLRGGTPEGVAVVGRGTRIVQPSYVEMDAYYRFKGLNGKKITTVTTLAMADALFHYTGEFSSRLTLRNLYAIANINDETGLWMGSRMYRGDDIYLLDFWPLDDVNTVGAGAWYDTGKLRINVHAGLNRLLDPFQYQVKAVADPVFGSEEVVQLDRQRFIATTHTTYRFHGPPTGPAMKVKAYAEIQALPEGTRIREDDTTETLAADFGYAVGLQFGAWLPKLANHLGNSHINVFARFAQGLSAFDELQLPEGFNDDRQLFPKAKELLFGVSANYEFPRGGVLAGGYARRFVDADINDQDRDDGWQYIAAIRPHLTLIDSFQGALDLSYQKKLPRGISPTALVALDPAVFQIAPMLIYSPMGGGSYARPQFRFYYRAAHLNDGARDLYPLDDPRRQRKWVHFLGVQAEWWFNSTYR